MEPKKVVPKVGTQKTKRPHERGGSAGIPYERGGSAGIPSKTKYTCFIPVYKPSPMPPIKNPKPEEQTKPKDK